MAKTPTALVSSTSNAAGATTRGRISLTSAAGGILTMAITNGGTGPTVQCEGRILIAHASSLPAAGSEGTGDGDWKTVSRFGAGTSASAKINWVWSFGPGPMHLEVEFTGNTGQAVTVEAHVSTYD